MKWNSRNRRIWEMPEIRILSTSNTILPAPRYKIGTGTLKKKLFSVFTSGNVCLALSAVQVTCAKFGLNKLGDFLAFNTYAAVSSLQ